MALDLVALSSSDVKAWVTGLDTLIKEKSEYLSHVSTSPTLWEKREGEEGERDETGASSKLDVHVHD